MKKGCARKKKRCEKREWEPEDVGSGESDKRRERWWMRRGRN